LQGAAKETPADDDPRQRRKAGLDNEKGIEGANHLGEAYGGRPSGGDGVVEKGKGKK